MAERLSAKQNPIHNLPYEFEITGKDGEVQIGVNGRVGLTVYPDGSSRMRKRNAIKWPGGRKVQWLYAELDGVRVYIDCHGDDTNIIMSVADLYHHNGVNLVDMCKNQGRILRPNETLPWRGSWQYDEMDGVRVYLKEIDGRVHVVLTKQDLHP